MATWQHLAAGTIGGTYDETYETTIQFEIDDL